jgi:hypothetical protein
MLSLRSVFTFLLHIFFWASVKLLYYCFKILFSFARFCICHSYSRIRNISLFSFCFNQLFIHQVSLHLLILYMGSVSNLCASKLASFWVNRICLCYD